LAKVGCHKWVGSVLVQGDHERGYGGRWGQEGFNCGLLEGIPHVGGTGPYLEREKVRRS